MTPLELIAADLPPKTQPTFGAADPHYALFRLGTATVPFIPLVGSGNRGEEEFSLDDVRVTVRSEPYVPPAELQSLRAAAARKFRGDGNGEPRAEDARPGKCRLARLERETVATSGRSRLALEVQPLHYEDYVTANAFLDTELVSEAEPAETIRTRYTTGAGGRKPDPARLELSNICGVGVVYVTSEDQLILSRRTSSVAVYPDIVGFTSSGSCDWSDFAPPTTDAGVFRAAAREAAEELGDQLVPADLRLIAVGVDVEQFYFQFCFSCRTTRTAAEIERLHQSARDRHEQSLFWIDFSRPEPAAALLRSRQIEPAAEVAVLLPAMKRWGRARMEDLVEKYDKQQPAPTLAVRRDMKGSGKARRGDVEMP